MNGHVSTTDNERDVSVLSLADILIMAGYVYVYRVNHIYTHTLENVIATLGLIIDLS